MMTMPNKHIRRPGPDLNLLAALDALLLEGTVTAAADRLGLSQSGMSRVLGRLRQSFSDELFVRTSRGMAPTRRALELSGPLRRCLAELEALSRGAPAFDPALSERRFRIAANDYAQVAVLAPLARRIGATAPGIRIDIVPLSAEAEADLDAGALDLLLTPQQRSGPGVIWTPLFEDGYSCLRDRRYASSRLTLRRFVALEHVLVAPRGRPGGIVDDALSSRGLARQVTILAPTFALVPHLLAGTARVCTVPTRMARELVRRAPLALFPPPLEVPGFTMCQAWHELHRGDAAHRWLRELTSEVARRRLRAPRR